MGREASPTCGVVVGVLNGVVFVATATCRRVVVIAIAPVQVTVALGLIPPNLDHCCCVDHSVGSAELVAVVTRHTTVDEAGRGCDPSTAAITFAPQLQRLNLMLSSLATENREQISKKAARGRGKRTASALFHFITL